MTRHENFVKLVPTSSSQRLHDMVESQFHPSLEAMLANNIQD